MARQCDTGMCSDSCSEWDTCCIEDSPPTTQAQYESKRMAEEQSDEAQLIINSLTTIPLSH